MSCLCAVLAALAGCAKQDGSAILGRWHTERFDVMGLKLPVGPDLTISRDKLSMQDGDLPISAIEQNGDEIVLDTVGGIGVTFHVVDADRVYIQVPLLDRIYYRRVAPAGQALLAGAGPRQAAPAQPAPAPAAAQMTAPVATATPPAAAQSSGPAYAPAYDAAVQAARQGQRDVALRYLHQAARQGLDRPDLIEQEAGFAALKSDPRYQVIVLNLAKR